VVVGDAAVLDVPVVVQQRVCRAVVAVERHPDAAGPAHPLAARQRRALGRGDQGVAERGAARPAAIAPWTE
jgi:hypothetical protein